ncbi:TPA: hypothetical protein K8N54_002652 [Serratia marcescens]|uniref:hypothetical protein n=1 Tax=Serratia marcescens TaxID=615 RepID=UPI0005973268|nr:hypothetical protein [Serratia marcescens]HBI6267065.1 hypothetical protein [Serratia marcescens]HBI6948335.1 hypothetical protein [Serratia marcescens]HBI6958354.1 hypothetical protein [Serratia marcescens]
MHKLAAPRQAIFAVIFSPSVVPLRHWAVFVVVACAEKPFFSMGKYEEQNKTAFYFMTMK